MIIISQEMGQPYFGVLHLGQSFYPFVKGLPKGQTKGLLLIARSIMMVDTIYGLSNVVWFVFLTIKIR